MNIISTVAINNNKNIQEIADDKPEYNQINNLEPMKKIDKMVELQVMNNEINEKPKVENPFESCG